MTFGKRILSLFMLALLIASAQGEHACVASGPTSDASLEHAHHSSSDSHERSERGDDGCDMYVPCSASIGVRVSFLPILAPTREIPMSEPRLSYYSPTISQEPPPPRG